MGMQQTTKFRSRGLLDQLVGLASPLGVYAKPIFQNLADLTSHAVGGIGLDVRAPAPLKLHVSSGQYSCTIEATADVRHKRGWRQTGLPTMAMLMELRA